MIAAGEWAPSCYRSSDGKYAVDKIVLGIMHGAAVGLGPFAAIHAIAVIDGHPTIWGDGALALVERSGLLQDMREDYTDDGDEGLTAVCTMRRRSWPTLITRRFSIQMAEEAGLTQKEGPWRTYPRRMLMMRARSWALRDGFADVLRGLSIREEVEDYDAVANPLAEPSVTDASKPKPVSCDRPVPRPRFADYPVRSSATRIGQLTARPRFADRNDCLLGGRSEAAIAKPNANPTIATPTAQRSESSPDSSGDMNVGAIVGPTHGFAK